MNLTPNGNNNIDDYYENLIENMKHKNCSICPPISRYFIFYFSMGFYSVASTLPKYNTIVMYESLAAQLTVPFVCL